MVGGPRRSNEQSLPANPFSQVQFPINLKQRKPPNIIEKKNNLISYKSKNAHCDFEFL